MYPISHGSHSWLQSIGGSGAGDVRCAGLQPAVSDQSHARRHYPISHRPDAGKVEADRDAVSAGLAFQLQPTAALACNKGPTPICCTN